MQNQNANNQPGLDEVAAKLNAILERASQIDQELMTLETLKQQNGKQSGEMKSFGPDKYIDFPNCNSYTNSNVRSKIHGYGKPGCGCSRCPNSEIRKEMMMGRREATSAELCQIMDVINELRMQVSALATRQNQMKSELNKIRGRLC